ncbi:cupin-like domain-containing protein [Bacillus dicomae]|uniref:Cupin n=1 Tax=Bacillus dicomae TaxID=3088378 RepID=A0AC61SZX5_9BACI|nr:cupin-like domain-containing protein [Bacillus dicomae]TPV39537.1 cupin [Bacillus dicomae]
MIERIDCKNLTYERFMKEFADKKPVILTNLVNNWECFNWDLKYLNERFGEQEVVIRKSDYEGKKKVYTVKLSKFIQLLEGGNEENWYCDWPFSIMGNREIALSYSIPSFLTEQTVRKKGDKELKWVFLGSTNTGTPLHKDFQATHNWNAVIFGKKKWVFFNPEFDQEMEYLASIDCNIFNPTPEEHEIILKANPYYIELNQGEIIYTPKNWWHQVINEELTFAISENFWFKHELQVN